MNIQAKILSFLLATTIVMPSSFAQDSTKEVMKKKAFQVYSGMLDFCPYSTPNNNAIGIFGASVAMHIILSGVKNNRNQVLAGRAYRMTDHAVISEDARLVRYLNARYVENKPGLQHQFAGVHNLLNEMDKHFGHRVLANGELSFFHLNGTEGQFTPHQMARIIQFTQFIPDQKLDIYMNGLRRFGYQRYIIDVDMDFAKVDVQVSDYFKKHEIIRDVLGVGEFERLPNLEKKFLHSFTQHSNTGFRRIGRGFLAIAAGYVVFRIYDGLQHDHEDFYQEMEESPDNDHPRVIFVMAKEDPEQFNIILDRNPWLMEAGALAYDERPNVCRNLKFLDETTSPKKL